MQTVISLPAKADTSAAEGLLSEVLSARGGPLRIDATGCRSIGGLCANVLVAAALSWRTDHHLFELTGEAGLIEDLDLLGVRDILIHKGEA